jgi:hypothetical protein
MDSFKSCVPLGQSLRAFIGDLDDLDKADPSKLGQVSGDIDHALIGE